MEVLARHARSGLSGQLRFRATVGDKGRCEIRGGLWWVVVGVVGCEW
jgi:hypothetical protein